jgi:hypothetical protein
MKIIYVDIDGTICRKTPDADYAKAVPFLERIKRVNGFYDAGHKIYYWTARGSTTGIDWSEVTRNQLSEWGAKYHGVVFGKPHYDLYIDDKSLNDTVLDKEKEIEDETIDLRGRLSHSVL